MKKPFFLTEVLCQELLKNFPEQASFVYSQNVIEKKLSKYLKIPSFS